MVEEMIPVVLFLVLGGIFWAMFYFRHRSRAETQQTIRLALDKGAQLTPELLDRLGEPVPDKSTDLRRGLVWLALGFGLALCGFFVPDPSGDALKGCLAGASFPVLIGIAYIVMWRYGVAKEARG